jgi:hypothetical protein
VVQSGTSALITADAPLAGTQSLLVAGLGSGAGSCYWPVTLPPSGTTTIAVRIKIPSYSPGDYGNGFATLGSFQVYNTWPRGGGIAPLFSHCLQRRFATPVTDYLMAPPDSM